MGFGKPWYASQVHPETCRKKRVEILVFGVYENPLFLCEAQTLDGTMLIMFLDRQNSENS